ncbi:MAG: type II toxin-antitoxin system prevent-host-death family antitoxin [Pseudomonadota bacterium]
MLISMHEFKSHLAKYVSQAQAGHIIELTSHRKVVARIVGVSTCEHQGITRLLAAGAATWSGGKPKGATLALSQGSISLSAMVLEDRG